MNTVLASESERKRLDHHLKSWGLRQFTDEAAYYKWQRESLSQEILTELNRLAQLRQQGIDSNADIDFYDFVARHPVLSVLYSQRYDYYLAVGPIVAARIESAQRVLDFGCGVGILTTYYAKLFPKIEFVGIDRSPTSIRIANEQANGHQLKNVYFEHLCFPRDSLSGSFDLIISTHALLQAEHNPGLPSKRWDTFSRAHDLELQHAVEARSGLQERLDGLCQVLTAKGRMLLVEKTQHLGRRVLLQRAVEARGFQLISQPLSVTYRSVDEIIEDGPLFEVTRDSIHAGSRWDERPEIVAGQGMYTCTGVVAEIIGSHFVKHSVSQRISISSGQMGKCYFAIGTWERALSYGYLTTESGFCGAILGSVNDQSVIHQLMGDFSHVTEEEVQVIMKRIWLPQETFKDSSQIPCYENHTLIAQKVWSSLPERKVEKEATFEEKDGKQMHIEVGSCSFFKYLYWANTYDQRQLVLMDSDRACLLEAYYEESLAGVENPTFDSGSPLRPESLNL